MDKEQLLELVDAYKGKISTKLLELIPSLMAGLDCNAFEDKMTEETLVLICMQGVGETLDAFKVAELPREIAQVSDSSAESGLKS